MQNQSLTRIWSIDRGGGHRKCPCLHQIAHSMAFLTLNFVYKVIPVIQNLCLQGNITLNMNILRQKNKTRGVRI